MKSRTQITIQQTQRLSLNLGLATAIRILRTDSVGLSRYLEEHAAENPQLVLGKQAPGDWLPRWRDAFARSMGAAPQPEPEAAGPSLISYVMQELAGMRLTGRPLAIAEALVEGLEPSGWLGTALRPIADRTGAALSEVEAVLTRLQHEIEPTGLFARSLAECLRLQAVDADLLSPAMAAVLDQLDLVASDNLALLARNSGLPEAGLRQAVLALRQFDPKPGASFAPGAAPLREPDLIARKGNAGWEISLNRSALPSLALAETKGKGRAEARALIRLVEGRNATLLSVGREILLRQVAALEAGTGALVAMTMTEIGEALHLHQSTVSRVVAGTAVDTPKGTWWLRALFSQSVIENGKSAVALRARLAQLIAAEDPAHPLSDDALAGAMATAGDPVARRTVAKYRDMLGLAPAHRRRRVAKPRKAKV